MGRMTCGVFGAASARTQDRSSLWRMPSSTTPTGRRRRCWCSQSRLDWRKRKSTSGGGIKREKSMALKKLNAWGKWNAWLICRIKSVQIWEGCFVITNCAMTRADEQRAAKAKRYRRYPIVSSASNPLLPKGDPKSRQLLLQKRLRLRNLQAAKIQAATMTA